ncbi:alpha/beta fold hydrolase [Streptomyces lasalocidi]
MGVTPRVCRGPYDLEQLADDAQRVIDVLGCSSHVLVAHSMGGTVAQMLGRPQARGATPVTTRRRFFRAST